MRSTSTFLPSESVATIRLGGRPAGTAQRSTLSTLSAETNSKLLAKSRIGRTCLQARSSGGAEYTAASSRRDPELQHGAAARSRPNLALLLLLLLWCGGRGADAGRGRGPPTTASQHQANRRLLPLPLELLVLLLLRGLGGGGDGDGGGGGRRALAGDGAAGRGDGGGDGDVTARGARVLRALRRGGHHL